MGQSISLDYSVIEVDVAKIYEATNNIIANIKAAISKVNDLKSSGGVEDVTVAAIAGKLEESHKALLEVPGMLDELSATLKKKSEELMSATGEATRFIGDL